MKPVKKRYHYWNVAAELQYVTPDGSQSAIKYNMIHKTEENMFATVDYVHSQKALQYRLHANLTELGITEYQTVDVFMIAISHLGYMTPEQMAPPSEEPAEPVKEQDNVVQLDPPK